MADETKLKLTRTPESWQFYAFMFAAAVTLALALCDEIPDQYQRERITAKLAAFFGLGYFLMVNERVRGPLGRVLMWLKEERR